MHSTIPPFHSTIPFHRSIPSFHSTESIHPQATNKAQYLELLTLIFLRRAFCTPVLHSSGGRTYTKVCGRVIGYQIGHPDAFHSSDSINSAYLEGVSITYGSFIHTHIWMLAADLSETGSSACPCDSGSSKFPPSFVGNNYYCESGNRNSTSTDYFLYADDPLWDGQQCSSEGTCCSNGRNPPWFSVDLNSPTTDSIEVRICADFNTSEDTPIEQLELYIHGVIKL